MFRSRPPLPVLKYYAYKATASVGLATPIWVLFLRTNGLSFTEIMVLDAIWWAGITLGEVPTGYVGDRVGWKRSLVVGNVLRTVAVVAMGASGTFWPLAGIYLLWALGSTLQSGNTDAWLYEVLDRDGDSDSDAFTRVRGRGQSLTLAFGAAGAVVGGYLGDVSLRWPFYATGALWALGVLVLLTFPNVTVDDDDRITAADALPVLRERLLSAELRGFVLWVAVVLAIASATARLTQPVTVGLGLPQAWLGWLYGGFSLLAAGASYRTEWLRDRFGLVGWVTLAPALLGVALALALVVPLAALPAFVLIRAVDTPTSTLATQYVNDRIETAGRATVLSGVSMVNAVVAIPFGVAVGRVADSSQYLALGLAGVTLVVLSAVAALRLSGGPMSVPNAWEVD
ncbi:MFS transporter [Haloarchaeobius sp. DYHT-AS-18]|uniref:MFS transporter n=1 Tax=Haloarchaeobius sp. DYHT-AS-18 TaxID=3446117 RepID=UPI003EB91474